MGPVTNSTYIYSRVRLKLPNREAVNLVFLVVSDDSKGVSVRPSIRWLVGP